MHLDKVHSIMNQEYFIDSGGKEDPDRVSWDPMNGERAYLPGNADKIYSATAANQVFILHNELTSGSAATAANQVAPPALAAAAGIVAMHFNTPIKMDANEDLELTTTGGSANHAITVCGYLK